MIRKVCTYILNYGGMGTKEFITPQKHWSIPIIDNDISEMPIRTRDEAIRLLKEIIAPN